MAVSASSFHVDVFFQATDTSVFRMEADNGRQYSGWYLNFDSAPCCIT